MEPNHMLPQPPPGLQTQQIPARDQSHPNSLSIQHDLIDRKMQPLSPEQQPLPTLPSTKELFATGRQFKLPSYPPPSYSQAHDVKSNLFDYPDAAPNVDLAPIQPLKGQQDDFTRSHKKNQSSTTSLPSFSALTASPQPPIYQSSVTSRPPIEPSSSATAVDQTPPNPEPPQQNHWPSLNPLTAYYTPSHVQNADSPMHMDVDDRVSAASPDRIFEGRASSVSLDDPDVRLAAEALGDLRADFVSSPPNRNSPLPGSPASVGQQAEPLISLLTTSHPLLATTIENATSAYNSSKELSPRFKSSVEYVEGYVSPIASTVGSVSRGIGVEGGIRWFLGGGRRKKSGLNDLEAGASKRRRVDNGSSRANGSVKPPGAETPQTPISTLSQNSDRRLSITSTTSTLPAYDDFRSPPYAESSATPETRSSTTSNNHGNGTTNSSSNPAWQNRIIMSTSGLSIAMSEESLRSLKFCLSWLRWANGHIAGVIGVLQQTMETYDNRGAHAEQPRPSADGTSESSTGAGSLQLEEPLDQTQLAAKITELKADVLTTLQRAITTVSRYAGGALPENARELVRKHLASLPQRFWAASMQGEGAESASSSASGSQQPSGSSEPVGAEAKEREMREGAQKVMVLAKEGLDMMAQVSGVLDGTIVSAEEWCERLGRRKREERRESVSTAPLEDVKMG